MAFAKVREVIDQHYGNEYVIPSKDIENFSAAKYSTFKKYKMKINGNEAVGVVCEMKNDKDRLIKSLSKRSRAPPLLRCETNIPEVPEVKSGKKFKQDKQVAKVRIIDDRVLPEEQQVDLSKVKKEIVEAKKKKAASLNYSDCATRASCSRNTGDKLWNDLLNIPTKTYDS
ncbi:hypothetical protein QAD02_021384 [Eretmocerus hayati]|uniref:Uncharacterized protein n=1 Tax=Eretmocerus hayati TaxID=131215 RepID=A0ACC2PRJ0_9HYME|nr:hypothetical protein QAD02_021384 [Eretmocerus hayati]